MKDEYRRWRMNTEDNSSPAKATIFVYWVVLCLILCCFELTLILDPCRAIFLEQYAESANGHLIKLFWRQCDGVMKFKQLDMPVQGIRGQR